ncbi:hypothetical protein D3C80_1336160 [compost metagenome]
MQAVEAKCLALVNPEGRITAGTEQHTVLLHSHQALPIFLAHHETRAEGLHPALACSDDKRPTGFGGHFDLQLTFAQHYQALAGIEAQVHSATGVETQARAIGQGVGAALAGTGVQVGQHITQRHTSMDKPRAAQPQQQHRQPTPQHLAPRRRSLRAQAAAGHGQLAWGALLGQLQVGQGLLEHRVDPLPGRLVARASLQPQLEGVLHAAARRRLFEFEQPAHRFVGSAIDRYVTHSGLTLRQCKKARRRSRSTVASDTPKCSAIDGWLNPSRRCRMKA